MDGIRAIQGRILAIQQRIEGSPLGDSAATQAKSANSSLTTLDTKSDFDSLMSKALGSDSLGLPADDLGSISTSHVHDDIPVGDLKNGELPDSVLESLGVGSHKLKPQAADSFKRMHAAATLDGVHIGITDSYRDLPTQERLAVEKGLYKNGGLAAVPGTSEHGWGNAVDLDLDSNAQAWMRANGERYGFVEDVPREPWHWTFHG